MQNVFMISDYIKWEKLQARVKRARALQIHASAHAVACVSFHIKQWKKLRACNVLLFVPSVKACYQKAIVAALKTVCMHRPTICYMRHICKYD